MLGIVNKTLVALILIALGWAVWNVQFSFGTEKYTDQEIEQFDKNNMLARKPTPLNYGPVEQPPIEYKNPENVIGYWNYDQGLTARSENGEIGKKIRVCNFLEAHCVALTVVGRTGSIYEISIPRTVFATFADPGDGNVRLTITGEYE